MMASPFLLSVLWYFSYSCSTGSRDIHLPDTRDTVHVRHIQEVLFRIDGRSFLFLLSELTPKYMIGTGLCPGSCYHDGLFVLPENRYPPVYVARR